MVDETFLVCFNLQRTSLATNFMNVIAPTDKLLDHNNALLMNTLPRAKLFLKNKKDKYILVRKVTTGHISCHTMGQYSIDPS